MSASHLRRFIRAGKSAARVLMLVLPGAVSGCARAAAPIELVEQVKEAAGSYVEASPAAPVEVRVRVQPEHANQAARYQSAARATVLAYGRRFQTMPFTSITVVDPGWRGHNSSSSNGPSATIFAPARWLAPGLTVETERTVVHELGLRFWRDVTKCQSPENWFIEGINRYTSMPVVATQFAFSDTPPTYSFLEQRAFGGFIPRVIRTPLAAATVGNGLPEFRDDPQVDLHHLRSPHERQTAVAKTALTLGTLERWLGSPTWDAVLAAFASTSWSTCPRPGDLGRIANDVTGLDLSWFFSQAFESNAVFDYGIDRIVSAPSDPHDQTVKAGYRTTVIVRRLGDATFTGATSPRQGPFESGRGVELRVRFEDGSEHVDWWDGRDRSKAFEYESAARAQSAEVDPRHILLLDVNRTNNSLTLAPATRSASTIWSSRWSLWLQDLLLTYTSLF